MTGPDFTTALTTLGLDNHQAAAWLGVSVRAVQRYRVTGAPGPVAGMVRERLTLVEIIQHRPFADDSEYRSDYKIGYDDACKNIGRIASLALDWRD